MQTAISPPENWLELLRQKDEQIARLGHKLEVALHQLQQLQKLFKGSKTERFTPPSEQLSIFGDVTPAHEGEVQTQTITRRLPAKKENQ